MTAVRKPEGARRLVLMQQGAASRFVRRTFFAAGGMVHCVARARRASLGRAFSGGWKRDSELLPERAVRGGARAHPSHRDSNISRRC
jgi:hypothetical protein